MTEVAPVTGTAPAGREFDLPRIERAVREILQNY